MPNELPGLTLQLDGRFTRKANAIQLHMDICSSIQLHRSHLRGQGGGGSGEPAWALSSREPSQDLVL